MTRKIRISSPAIFKPIFITSEFYAHYDWLFDSNFGIISGFRPDILVAFNSNTAVPKGHFGYSVKIDRKLLCHPTFNLRGANAAPLDMKEETYVTMTRGDDTSLIVSKAGFEDVSLRPSKVFRANDVLAAESAVRLNIGYSALPEFMFDDNNQKNLSPVLTDWQVSPTHLRIESSVPPNPNLSKIHELLLSSLAPKTGGSWAAFGQKPNIVSMVRSA